MTPSVAISPWITIPLALAMMLSIAWSLAQIEETVQPASRRRIRFANGWILLLMLPLAASGFSLISHATHPRLFVMVWMLTLGLVGVSILLAMADVANTIRLRRRALRRSVRVRSELVRELTKITNAHSQDATRPSQER